MILVTGATGLVGAHLLLKLVQQNEEVRAIYRSEKKLNLVKRIFGYYVKNADSLLNDIEWQQCDITDVTLLERAFKGITKVYHCAAYISFDPNRFNDLQKANVEGTANVVNFCVKNKIKKLCYVSSIAAIGAEPNGEPITESTEFNVMDPNVYALTKNAAELEVWRGTQEDVPAVVVNPGVILGPGNWKRGSGAFFSENAKPRKFYLPGGTGFVGIEDVINAMIELMRSDAKNERYILVAENLSYREVQSKISEGFGHPPAKKEIKLWQIGLFWRIDWLRNRLFGSKRVLSKAMAKSFRKSDAYSSEKIKKAIGFQFRPIEDIIKFSCAIYLEENPPS